MKSDEKPHRLSMFQNQRHCAKIKEYAHFFVGNLKKDLLPIISNCKVFIFQN